MVSPGAMPNLPVLASARSAHIGNGCPFQTPCSLLDGDAGFHTRELGPLDS
jgi:hypothetical protein